MRFTANIVLASLILMASPVLAQEAAAPAAVKSGDVIFSADGWRLGRVDSLDTAKDGTPVAALIIFQGRMIRIPLTTVSTGAKGLTSTLKAREIK